LLRQIENGLGLSERLSSCMKDKRNSSSLRCQRRS